MENISYNFGTIRDSILKLSSAEIIKEEKSNTLNSFTKRLEENPVLKKQFLVYKNIQESSPFEKERLAERFIQQNLRLFHDIEWNSLLGENKKIRRELLDDIHITSKENDLFEAVHTLIESVTKRGYNEISKEQEAYEFVLSHLTRDVIEESEEVSEEKTDSPHLVKNAWKFITKNAINNFNERYSHLNEGEKKVFKILVSDITTKSSYFDNIKNENLELINSVIGNSNESDKEKSNMLESFRDKIENMSESSPENIDSYILNSIELKQILEDL